MDIIKLNRNIEYTRANLETAYNAGKRFLITEKNIYQIFFSDAQNTFYTTKIYTARDVLQLVKRGYHILATAQHVNYLLDFNLVN